MDSTVIPTLARKHAPRHHSVTANHDATLQVLIAAIRRVVAAEDNPRRVSRVVAEVLRPFLDIQHLLTPEQQEPDPLTYRQHVLHVETDGTFSIAALVWLAGQATPIHDHVSWCVVGVYKGVERETRYQLCGNDGESYLAEIGSDCNRAGTVHSLAPPGDIHQVTSAGHGRTVSLHIYGADLDALGCSVRRKYEIPVRQRK